MSIKSILVFLKFITILFTFNKRLGRNYFWKRLKTIKMYVGIHNIAYCLEAITISGAK